MHNSGLPKRYKNDWNEFEEVVVWVGRPVDTGVVEMVGIGERRWTVEVVHECYLKYSAARRTVQKNKLAAYIPSVAKAAAAGGDSKEG